MLRLTLQIYYDATSFVSMTNRTNIPRYDARVAPAQFIQLLTGGVVAHPVETARCRFCLTVHVGALVESRAVLFEVWRCYGMVVSQPCDVVDMAAWGGAVESEATASGHHCDLPSWRLHVHCSCTKHNNIQEVSMLQKCHLVQSSLVITRWSGNMTLNCVVTEARYINVLQFLPVRGN